MNAIRVTKNDLLKAVRENREKHRTIFLEAQKSYRDMAITELEMHLADARGGKRISRSLTLIEPMDQTKDYDRVIRMLEMTSDDAILLEEHDFRTYVLDEWKWKSQFNVSNAMYSKTLGDTLAGEQS